MPLFLRLSKPAQLRLIVALRDEHGQGSLYEGRRVADHQAAQRPQLFNEFGRSHDIAHAQPRCHAFGEAADVDDAVAAIQALQCRDGLLIEAAFAFVVILDDDEIMLLAVSSRASRLSRGMVTPVGHWWLG